MTSIFSTVINFGMLGLMRRVHRLQIQSQLQAESSKTNIVFPQLQKHRAKEGSNLFVPIQSLAKTTDTAIALAVQRAKQRAQTTVEELGMADLLKTRDEWDEDIPALDSDETDIFGDSSDDSDFEDNADFKCLEDTNTSEVDVARDIDNLSKNKFISPDLECKLNRIQQSLPRLTKVSTADSLPVYEESVPASLVPSEKRDPRNILMLLPHF